MPSLITLRISCLKVGQASINATVRHWGNPAMPVQLSDWKELRVPITQGAVSNRTDEKTPSCQAL
jgi:hypothetical protein